MSVERGVVKFFDGREGKQFGFLSVLADNGELTKEQLFFHYNGGEFIVGLDTRIFWAGRTAKKGNVPVKLKAPETGDELIFQRGRNNKGPIAQPWGLANQFDKTEGELARRLHKYRVVRIDCGPDGGREEHVVWEGTSRLELSSVFPKKEVVRNGNLTTDDELRYHSVEDAGVSWWLEIQRQRIDSEWAKVKTDPRYFECCVPPAIFLEFDHERSKAMQAVIAGGYRQSPDCDHDESPRNLLMALGRNGWAEVR